ncbi:Psp-related protein [Tritrichomonas foetus]|uniref:Psp-related protein n=1 Tax=Tritrichomonas foetus TaxID=1144522 RepID=A0A1J4K5A4_9EUKA|nr:Psp-related protein [Tritrichomonas foetus]|eukprot:OHT06379.1 Psp-related protein [Tritrichomonas foetus]
MLIEEKAKKFERRPPSQFQQSKFYFRGGDVLREQEYLREEYRSALAELRVAQQQAKIVSNQLEDAKDVYNEREGYTNALKAFLESDTKMSEQERSMKDRLVELEHQIEEDSRQLEALKATMNPATLAQLQKEKAYYMIEIQKGERTIESYNEQRDNAKNQIAACTINGKYRTALELEFLNDKYAKKKKYLRQLVQQLKIDFEALRPVIPSNDQESKIERTALMAQINDKITLLRVEEKEKRREQKHIQRIDNLINQIEELNDRMCEIGLDNDVVETEELRKRCIIEDYSDEEEQEAEDQEYSNEAETISESNHKTSEGDKKPSNESQSGESFERYEGSEY